MGAWQAVTAPISLTVASSSLFGIPIATNMQDSGWTTPSFTNSWANGGNVAYRSIGNQVRLRGITGGGSTGTVAFTLPTGFRPTGAIRQVVIDNSGAQAVCNISAGGAVSFQWTGNGNVSMDGVTFLVD